ncbi:MAG: LysR family transcriptional regulator, partial [Pseudomonadota bacterium]
VNHSTVFRRVEMVEGKLGVRLFERKSHGYVMTRAGELFYQRANVLCEGMNRMELELAGRDLRLEGKLTVTTTDTLLHCLAPVFVTFQEENPNVELRLLSDARPADLMQGDADIALRPTPAPPEHWVGRKILPIPCATYADKDYWSNSKSLPKETHRWIVLDEDLSHSPMSQLVRSHMAEEAPVTVVNTVMGVFDLVRNGSGIAALPCYLAEDCSTLVRVHEPAQKGVWDLWLLAHPDVRRSARVHAFFDFASSAITADVLRMPNN